MNSFFNTDELKKIGFKTFGNNVLISRKASFYSYESIEIGSNVRIDDFCILSGKIKLGSFIHISAYCALYGQYEIELKNYSGLSPRTTIFSASDDFSGNFLIGPMSPKETTNVIGGKVLIKQYAHIGTGSVIMPNVIIEEGSIVGAMSFVNKSTNPWTINYGIPIKEIKKRKSDLLKYFYK